MERIQVAGLQNPAHGTPRQIAAVLLPFLPRSRLALLGVDSLHRRIGVEVAAENVRPGRFAVGCKEVQHDGQLREPAIFVGFVGAGVEMNDAEGPFRAAGLDHGRLQQRFGNLGPQGGVIDGVADRPPAEQRRGMTVAGGGDEVHPKPVGDLLEDGGILRLDQRDHVRALAFNDVGQRTARPSPPSRML